MTANGAKALNPHGGDKQPDAHKVGTYGKGSAYLTARIARDRPDVWERMKAGELRGCRRKGW